MRSTYQNSEHTMLLGLRTKFSDKVAQDFRHRTSTERDTQAGRGTRSKDDGNRKPIAARICNCLVSAYLKAIAAE